MRHVKGLQMVTAPPCLCVKRQRWSVGRFKGCLCRGHGGCPLTCEQHVGVRQFCGESCGLCVFVQACTPCSRWICRGQYVGVLFMCDWLTLMFVTEKWKTADVQLPSHFSVTTKRREAAVFTPRHTEVYSGSASCLHASQRFPRIWHLNVVYAHRWIFKFFF